MVLVCGVSDGGSGWRVQLRLVRAHSQSLGGMGWLEGRNWELKPKDFCGFAPFWGAEEKKI